MMLAPVKKWLRYATFLIPALPIAFFERDHLINFLQRQAPDVASYLKSSKESDQSAVDAESANGLVTVPRSRERTPATLVSVPTAEAVKSTMSQRPVTLEEALSFQVTIPWILGHWPRVTTQLSLLDMQGYRVPLVTGTTIEDLAGSLTYYFGPGHKLVRIAFTGTTGDSRRLIRLLEQRFGFEKHATTNPNLYLYQVLWNGEPKGQLWIQPAAVVDVEKPFDRFEVTLAIDRPSEFSSHSGR